MLEVMAQTLRTEFAGLDDVAQLTGTLARLLLAALLGGALGWERESHGKSAGVRTHMLVSLGSAMFVLAPAHGGMQIGDLSRVIQGIVTGIGFLGAGAIIKHREINIVKGMTSAAGLWATAAIGIACGLGREVTAIVSTLLVLAVLAVIPKWTERDR